MFDYQIPKQFIMTKQKVLVFKTNLSTVVDFLVAKWLLDSFPGVMEWSLDQDDCDNVLRVVGKPNLNEFKIMNLVDTIGYHCKPLI